jgi:Secretion system C-terminal sorting domain
MYKMKKIVLISWILIEICYRGASQGCPSNLNLTTVLNSTARHQSAQTITASNTVILNGNDSVIYQAGGAIELLPSFQTFLSGNAAFEARIAPCATTPYQWDTLRMACGQACMPVILNHAVVDGTGYTFRIHFDPAKIRPAVQHTLGRIVPSGSVSTFIQNGLLVLSISLLGTQNIQGSVGDTLICIGWEAVGRSAITTQLTGTVEENTTMQTTVDNLSVPVQIAAANNSMLFWMYVNGTSLMQNSTAANPTRIFSGNLGSMNYKGDLGGAGTFLLQPATVPYVQFKRQSLSTVNNGLGMPIIGGLDGAYTFKVIAGDPSYRPTHAAILAMDTDGDGRITSADKTNIQRRAVGIYKVGFPQFPENVRRDTPSARHFPKSWLTSRPDFRISTTYPLSDGVGYSYDRVPRIDSVFRLDSTLIGYCDTSAMDVAMILLGDVNGDYAPSGMPRYGRQNVATMNYEVCKNGQYDIRNNVLYVKVYADKNLTGGDWSIQNSPLTLLGAEVVNSTTTSLMSNLVGNDLFITASAIGADIPAGTPLFYLKIPATQKDSIRNIAKLGQLTSYWNAAIADNEVRFCTTPVCPGPNCPDPPSPIRLYPNPTSDGLITIEHLDKTPESIQVYNALGQLVIAQVEPQLQKTALDLTNFADGVYLVKVDNQTFKVVKK